MDDVQVTTMGLGGTLQDECAVAGLRQRALAGEVAADDSCIGVAEIRRTPDVDGGAAVGNGNLTFHGAVEFQSADVVAFLIAEGCKTAGRHGDIGQPGARQGHGPAVGTARHAQLAAVLDGEGAEGPVPVLRQHTLLHHHGTGVTAQDTRPHGHGGATLQVDHHLGTRARHQVGRTEEAHAACFRQAQGAVQGKSLRGHRVAGGRERDISPRGDGQRCRLDILTEGDSGRPVGERDGILLREGLALLKARGTGFPRERLARKGQALHRLQLDGTGAIRDIQPVGHIVKPRDLRGRQPGHRARAGVEAVGTILRRQAGDIDLRGVAQGNCPVVENTRACRHRAVNGKAGPFGNLQGILAFHRSGGDIQARHRRGARVVIEGNGALLNRQARAARDGRGSGDEQVARSGLRDAASAIVVAAALVDAAAHCQRAIGGNGDGGSAALVNLRFNNVVRTLRRHRVKEVVAIIARSLGCRLRSHQRMPLEVEGRIHGGAFGIPQRRRIIFRSLERQGLHAFRTPTQHVRTTKEERGIGILRRYVDVAAVDGGTLGLVGNLECTLQDMERVVTGLGVLVRHRQHTGTLFSDSAALTLRGTACQSRCALVTVNIDNDSLIGCIDYKTVIACEIRVRVIPRVMDGICCSCGEREEHTAREGSGSKCCTQRRNAADASHQGRLELGGEM